jgi:hypothetical protein
MSGASTGREARWASPSTALPTDIERRRRSECSLLSREFLSSGLLAQTAPIAIGFRLRSSMPRTDFVTLPADVWVLSDSIAPERRAILSAPPSFVETVAALRKHASIHSCKRARPNRSRTPWPKRVVVVLAFPEGEQWVDVFHNSASGVRAQCLHNVGLGREALAYARDVLRSRAIELLGNRSLTRALRDFAHISLCNDSAKVWIHQGLWVRHARAEARDLRIATWVNCTPKSKHEADLLRYGSKAPERPALIDVLGGLYDESGAAMSGKPPLHRPDQVNRFGFT